MIVVGLTGGIGSGKTTVAHFFEAYDIPIYFADLEAKQLMVSSKIIRKKLTALFGSETYVDNQLNRAYIASKIFNDSQLLAKMNAIVHPKVASHFKNWLKQQKAPYIIKEVAIIFEHHNEHLYDLIITVIADKETRINRVLKRDKSSRAQIEMIMENQLSDAEKVKKSNFVIFNNSRSETKKQVKKIHLAILKHIRKTVH